MSDADPKDVKDPPPGTRPPWKVDRLYAFVTLDNDGDEGVVACMTPWGIAPAMGADMDRVNQIRVMVQEATNRLGRPVYLRYFETMREIETIYPQLPVQGDKPS